MTTELKQRWIEALRGGKYRQSHQVLRTQAGEFCATGVLCDLIDPDGWKQESPSIQTYHWHRPLELKTVWAYPMWGDLARYVALEHLAEISQMNDGWEADQNPWEKTAPKSFAEIADWIEENL